MSTETPENTNPTDPQVSSALEFRKRSQARNVGELITLPASGLVVRVKRPDIQTLIAKGIIPQAMVQRFMRLKDDKSTSQNLSPEDIEYGLQYREIMVQYALIEPRVVAADTEPHYDDGEISLDDIDTLDKDAIIEYVNGGVKTVQQFPETGIHGVLPGPDSEAVSG